MDIVRDVALGDAGRGRTANDQTPLPSGGSTAGHQWRGVIEEYRGWLPVVTRHPVVTLREGGTPLVESGWLSELTGCAVWLKVEGANPTGSFKDRGMTLAVSHAAERGRDRRGLRVDRQHLGLDGGVRLACRDDADRALPQGKIARGKMAQAVMHGARSSRSEAASTTASSWRERSRRTIRSRWSTPSTRSGSRVRRRRPSRWSTCSAMLPTCTCCRSATPATSRRTGRAISSTPLDGPASRRPRMWGFQAEGAAPLVPGQRGAHAGDRRDRDPGRQPGVLAAGRGGARRVRRGDRGGDRPPDPRRARSARRPRRRVRRAGIGGRRRRPAAATRRGPASSPAAGSSSPSPATV